MSPALTMPRTARCAAVKDALNPSRSGKQCAAMSMVLMTRNRFANNNARVHIRSFKTFVDNVAAIPRLTLFGDVGAGGGVLVDGAGTASEGGDSTGAGDGRSSVPCVATVAAEDGISVATGATGASNFLPRVTTVFATVTRAFAPAVVGARATVCAALVSSDVVFGSLVFLVMSQAP